jgi:hypothetical protein
MTGTTQGGGTKWDAVRAAITGFLNDPKSAGLGVGLQYFPLIVPGTTAQSCANDAACGALTPCINNKACAVNGAVTFCQTSADCPGNAACEDVGACAFFPQFACIRGFAGCPAGPCNYFAMSYCAGRDKCTVVDYATPAAPIAQLPAAAGALIGSLNGRTPDGLTPTGPALQGAIDQSKAFATANAGHTVVTVLVTDGFPTECSPQSIPAIAAIATAGVNGTPSIKTFVIGVFTQAEQAQATTNLNQIASAGGTNQAFVITTNQNVTQQFQQALATIRGASLPCDYQLPVPQSGTPDYTKVNVQFTTGAGAVSVIPYVTNAQGCDPQAGGWHYDVDPAGPTKPSKVVLCPASCNVVKADPGGKIDVVQGCKTIVK